MTSQYIFGHINTSKLNPTKGVKIQKRISICTITVNYSLKKYIQTPQAMQCKCKNPLRFIPLSLAYLCGTIFVLQLFNQYQLITKLGDLNHQPPQPGKKTFKSYVDNLHHVLWSSDLNYRWSKLKFLRE